MTHRAIEASQVDACSYAFSFAHVWSHDGKVLDRITLEIVGSRASGYRTWSHVTRFGKHPEGKWKVRVVTDEGQLIGVEQFTVVRD